MDKKIAEIDPVPAHLTMSGGKGNLYDFQYNRYLNLMEFQEQGYTHVTTGGNSITISRAITMAEQKSGGVVGFFERDRRN